MIIACILVLSLCACGNTESKNDGATNATSATEVDKTVELQKYYESYFNSEDFGFAGNSIVATTDGATIEISQAEDNSGKVSIGYGENLFEVYKTADNKQFAHIIMPDEETGETADAWYQCKVDEKAEDEKDVFESMTSDTNFDEYKIEPDKVKDIKYLRTEDGIDYISAVTNNSDSDTETTVTTYEIEFKQDDNTYSFTYVVQEADGVSGNISMDENVPEDFSALDFDFDFEKNVMTNKETGKNIPFTVVSKTDGEQSTNIEIGVDAKTHKIVSISGEENGANVMVKFSTLDTIEVNVPDTVEECDEETLAMLYLSAIFSFAEQ